VKKRWKVAIGLGAVALAGILAPIFYIEGGCRRPLPGLEHVQDHVPLLPLAEHRPEARTWLTYPEWHIVYSADSFGRHLRDRPPSSFAYWRDIKGFWKSYCLLNRATLGRDAAGDAKVMIYTIGLSFSAEMAIKSIYENTLGRLFEWIGGWPSVDDRHAAKVQQDYGAFMHQTPWYRFPFGSAFGGLWRTDEDRRPIRHWERRFALSLEYGVKAGYAKVIDKASGATLGRDELSLRLVTTAPPVAVAAVDRRLKPVRSEFGRTVVEAPRYAEFTELVEKLAASRVGLVEIAGNDDIFVTLLVPPGVKAPGPGLAILSMPLGERPGWRRIGVTVKVPQLLDLVRHARRSGSELEHVYDY
jgi:hypothetical protein